MLETINSKHANKTLKWTGTDTKSRFEKISKLMPGHASVKFYKDNPIDYTLNNYGFRTPDDFKFEKGNVFLGCSITFGFGVHLEDSWSYRLSKELGGKFWNLAVGGSGIGTACRLLNDIQKVVKVDNVFLYMPFPYRYEMYLPDDNTWKTWSPTDERDPNGTLASNWFKRSLVDEKNMLQYWRTNYDAIRWYCHKNKLPLYALTGQNARYQSNMLDKIDNMIKTRTDIEYARDFMHPNPISHLGIFEDFKKLLIGEKVDGGDPTYKPDFLNKTIKKSLI